MKKENAHEQEIEYMISELATTEMGREALRLSGEAVKRSGWEKQAKKFMKSKSIIGEKMPQGVPFRLKDLTP
uniref:Uncharacterized protein n=1 Tax=viral metagenome TaxID=1070528 RepID=A0A6H1ZHD0_9ZZZZ